jgi:hypothetical protein
MIVNKFRFPTAAAALAAMCLSLPAFAGSLKGKIYIADEDGIKIEGDQMEDPCEAYLNSGKRDGKDKDANKDGLEDGEYYFQVTSEDKKTLLSNDSIDQRRFRVANGMIVQFMGISAPCTHELGDNRAVALFPDSISVQLMPFDAPPKGNEYRVWVTRCSDYAPDNAKNVFGFDEKRSVHETFKVKKKPFKGKIHVADRDGNEIKGDTVCNPWELFLDAGKKHGKSGDCNKAKDGLPTGEYYFQVTDDKGKVLLSCEDIEQRRFRAENGVIVEYLGTSGPCHHETGIGRCSDDMAAGISIQLSPFVLLDHGNKYQVWVTPVDDYNPADPKSAFGFSKKRSKTAHFKVKCKNGEDQGAETTLIIQTYQDTNANGDNDGEPPLDGIQLNVGYVLPGCDTAWTLVTTGTDASGQVSVTIPGGSWVRISQNLPGTGEPNCRWEQMEPSASSTFAELDNGTWIYSLTTDNTNDAIVTLEFGDAAIGRVAGGKSTSFWSNSKGKRVLKANDKIWRRKINQYPLRKVSGRDFDLPKKAEFDPTFETFQKFLRRNNANNMANQLSTHTAAARLAAVYAGLNKRQRVIISDQMANALGISGNLINVNTAIARAKASLGLNALTVVTSPARNYQQALRDLLKAINANSLPTVRTEPCNVVY